MSATERQALNERLSKYAAYTAPELNSDTMGQCGYKLINGEVDTTNVTLVTEESSESVFAFMYKVLGEDPFLAK